MVTVFKTKCCYEFLLSNVSKINTTVYSPPFGTSHDMFWQLEFIPSSVEEPDHCAAFLFAIPNHDEANCSGVWSRRSVLTAKIYLKNAKNQTFLKKQSVKMNSFSAKLSGWGWEAFYNKSSLPEHVLFGVEFDRAEMAWEGQLNNPATSDCQFNVQGQIIYANSAILCARSKYFELVFRDFHHQTFLEMLRFLYTNKVTFVEKKDEQNSQLTPLDLFRIADKYLIDDLRQHAKSEIFKDLNVNDAAEFLFGTAWKYPELKEQAMKYVVLNFVTVRQTS
ncbi:33387_t:CDS:2, partial [Racocetra persica]